MVEGQTTPILPQVGLAPRTKKPPMASPRFRLIPLDFTTRTGGTSWAYKQGRRSFAIDFGANLEREAVWLKGVRLRDGRGIDDRVGLGLLPSLGGRGLREDLLLDPDLLDDAPNLGLEALLLDHAHADHFMNMFALDLGIDVHASSVSVAYLLAHFLTSQGLAAETTHAFEREPHPQEEGLLWKPRGAEARPRRFGLVDGAPSEPLRALFREAGSDEGLFRSPMEAAGMRFEALPIDHSLFGAVSYLVHTAAGPVAHLTDLRNHGANGKDTDRALRRCEKVGLRAALIDGTCLGREDQPRYTEAGCRDRIVQAVRGAGRRMVVASFGGRHVERLAAFLLAAQETRRRLVVSPRTMLLLEAIGAADPRLDFTGLDGLAVYDRPQGSRQRWHSDARERWDGLLVSPEEIAKSPNRFVVSYEAGRREDWFHFKPNNGVFVFSSSAAHDDEARGRHASLAEWLGHFGMRAEGISFGPKGAEYDHALNPSGHLHLDDLKAAVDRIRPEVLIPIHTGRPELFRDFLPKGTKLVMPQEGKPIWL